VIKAIIFDCFGVLLGNTYKQRAAQLEQDDPEKAKELRAINHASDMGILSRDEAARYMAELLDVEPEELLQEQDEGEVQNTELITFIATLKGKYQLGLLSNINGRERLGIRFEPGQLDTLFNTVVASGDEGYVKPQPEIYHIVATRLGVQPEECVMIDDIAEFCDGARAVGMQAIQFVTTRQCIQDLQAVIDRGE
jgi:epoxide hydrolase-like predicted phosphatase